MARWRTCSGTRRETGPRSAPPLGAPCGAGWQGGGCRRPSAACPRTPVARCRGGCRGQVACPGPSHRSDEFQCRRDRGGLARIRGRARTADGQRIAWCCPRSEVRGARDQATTAFAYSKHRPCIRWVAECQSCRAPGRQAIAGAQRTRDTRSGHSVDTASLACSGDGRHSNVDRTGIETYPRTTIEGGREDTQASQCGTQSKRLEDERRVANRRTFTRTHRDREEHPRRTGRGGSERRERYSPSTPRERRRRHPEPQRRFRSRRALEQVKRSPWMPKSLLHPPTLRKMRH